VNGARIVSGYGVGTTDTNVIQSEAQARAAGRRVQTLRSGYVKALNAGRTPVQLRFHRSVRRQLRSKEKKNWINSPRLSASIGTNNVYESQSQTDF
jgi:hypothetical protein